MDDPKYPNVTVQLSNEDENAVAIINRVMKALRKAGVPNDQVIAFRTEATSGDYDHLIQTAMAWVNVE